MAGLPHFLNSRASTKYYEPMYQNLFEVTVLPPATVSGGEILIEHVNKIAGLMQDKGSAIVEQKYKYATRSYADGVPTGTTVDLAVDFSLNLNDANELYVYKTIRDWWRLVWNPLTGEQGLKKDYVGTIIVTNYNRKGDIFWQRTFHDCMPSGDIPELALGYDAGAPIEFAGLTWRCDWWEENIV
jgi:hypothetical protein